MRKMTEYMLTGRLGWVGWVAFGLGLLVGCSDTNESPSEPTSDIVEDSASADAGDAPEDTVAAPDDITNTPEDTWIPLSDVVDDVEEGNDVVAPADVEEPTDISPPLDTEEVEETMMTIPDGVDAC